MIKKAKILLSSMLVVLSVAAAPLGLAATAYAQTSQKAVQEGVGIAGDVDKDKADNQVKKVIVMAVRIFQMIAGIITLFMIITAGVSYVTSGGDSAKTKTAKDRILYSAIGIAVVIMAEIIVQFMLNRIEDATTISG